MKKDLIGVGGFTLLWFVVLLILGNVAMLDVLFLGFWSILILSVIFLTLGLVVPEKKGS